MNTDSKEIIDVCFAEREILIPSKSWVPEKSYLISRELVDRNILKGKAYIGTLREQLYEPYDDGRKVFKVLHTNYGWVELNNGLVIDPCSFIKSADANTLQPVSNIGQFYGGLNPQEITTTQIPMHYNSDELYPIIRGLHKEVFGRLLGFKVEVSGLTILEAAFIANLPIEKLGKNSKLVYEFLLRNGLSRLIPYKHVKVVFPQMAKSRPNAFYEEQQT
ncbi:hypothetical protein ACI0X9_003254 [Cronobacter turicensis]